MNYSHCKHIGLQYEADTRESKLALQDVETRHRELIKIENALKEVKEMFTQLAFLVQQQVIIFKNLYYIYLHIAHML